MKNDIIVIPDIHGRKFWRQAVELYPDCDTIFLGDYLDPYPLEGIDREKALDNFEEIITHAHSHPNCHLLLGNHDLHYLCDFGESCRLDRRNAPVIRQLLAENLSLFAIATLREIDGKRVLFSHAPILTQWLETIGEEGDLDTVVDNLNALVPDIVELPWKAAAILGHISAYRGGYDPVGSAVWADLRETTDENIIRTADFSVFGHTQQATKPTITPRFACLDVRRAFRLTPDLRIIAL